MCEAGNSAAAQIHIALYTKELDHYTFMAFGGFF
jgi:hypothetical protein